MFVFLRKRKFSWSEIDNFTRKNIPITKWLSDSTLNLGHGIGLFPDGEYYEFFYSQRDEKVTELNRLSSKELRSMGLNVGL